MSALSPSPEMQRLFTIHGDVVYLLDKRLNLGAVVDKFYAEAQLDASLWHTDRRCSRLSELLVEAIGNDTLPDTFYRLPNA